MTVTHLTPDQVPAHLRGAYKGRTFKAIAAESVTIPADAGLWSGGSRELYKGVRLSDGLAMLFPGQDAAPWDRPGKPVTVNIPRGYCVVLESMFCGSDMGLTFYVNPADIAAILPPVEDSNLSREAEQILCMTAGLVAKARREYAARNGINANQFDRIKESLADAGYLDSRGAITVKGRNLYERIKNKPHNRCF